MVNIEPLAALCGDQMHAHGQGADENLITKALMVVAEQGIYALGLFLAYQENKNQPALHIHRALINFINEANLLSYPQQDNRGVNTDFYRQLVEGNTPADIAKILLRKQAIELALTYGRYHAKSQAEG